MFGSLLHFLDRFRTATALVTLLALAASAWFLTQLKILDSPERWMPASTLEAWQVFEQHFEAGDTIGIGLHFRRPIVDDDAASLAQLRRRLQAVEGMRQVYDCSLVSEQIERTPLTELIDPANAARFELYNGALWDNPRSGDSTRTLMTVCELVFEPEEDKQNPDVLNDRRRHVTAEVARICREESQLPAWEGVDFHVAGGIMMMSEMEQRTRQVAWRFLPASIAIGLLSLWLSFRNWRVVVVAVGGSTVGMLLALGLMGATGASLGVVTMAAPALISIIAIASTVHFASFAGTAAKAGGAARRELVRWVGAPCLGAAATTGVGFWMLGFNELEPIRDLGAQMMLGSLLAFFGVFFISQWTPIFGGPQPRLLSSQRLGTWGLRVTSAPRLLVTLSLGVVLLLAFAAWPRPKDRALGLYVDADPFSFFADDQPIKQALNHFSDREFAVFQLDVILIPKELGTPAVGLESPDETYRNNQQAAEAFQDRVAQRRDLGVIRALTTLGFNRRYDQFLHEIHRAGERDGYLQAVLQLGPKATSANVLSQSFKAWKIDKQQQGALRMTFVAHDTPEGFEPLVRYVQSVLPHEHFACYLAGSVKQNVDLTRGLSQGMMWGIGVSLLVMGGLCMLLFRSRRLALIAMLPNVFPILTVFGVMGVFRIPISSGSAMVATIALGIALNDTIHFMMHYRELTRTEGRSPRTAVQLTIQHVGRPIVITSVVHILGFWVFLLTDFVPLYQFGLLSSVAMAAALAGDLVLLPNLLLALDRVSPPAGKAGQTPPHDGSSSGRPASEPSSPESTRAAPSIPGPKIWPGRLHDVRNIDRNSAASSADVASVGPAVGARSSLPASDQPPADEDADDGNADDGNGDRDAEAAVRAEVR